MRVLFAGSSAIAVPSLEVLSHTEGIELVGVLTNPDTAKGRHSTLLPTETGEAAEKILKQFEGQGRETFPVFKPEKLDTSFREQIAAQKPELLVSFAYGRFFGPKFLSLFPLGGINIHPSLLPKYRGPSPIQAAILNRDTETGISVQKLAPEMDSGDILAQDVLQLTGNETTGVLSEIAAREAGRMLPAVLKKIAAGESGIPQDHGKASYCALISRDDAVINWKESAAVIEAKVRAFDPWPLCRTIHNSRELFILKASVYNGENDGLTGGKTAGFVIGTDKNKGILIQTGSGILAVAELQYQGKKALSFRDFLNGARDFSGSTLG